MQNVRSKILLFSAAVLLSLSSYAQDTDHVHIEGHEHIHANEHEGDDHHHHGNEISIATGIVPLLAEDEISVGFHLHYIRGIGEKKRLGIGLGLEAIIDEHRHYTISAVIQYRVYKGLILSTAPGLLVLINPGGNLYQFAEHFEITYEMEVGNFHIGPVLELGVEKAGLHFMAGVHFGIDF